MKRFVCWRPNLFAYDLDYNNKHQETSTALEGVTIINARFDGALADEGSVVVNDAIWYPGVFDNMLTALD